MMQVDEQSALPPQLQATRRGAKVLELVKTHASYGAAATHLGISRQAVQQIISRYYPDFNIIEYRNQLLRSQIQACIDQGIDTTLAISAHLGWNPQTTRSRLQTLKIQVRLEDGERTILNHQTIGSWTVLYRVYRQPDGTFTTEPNSRDESIYYWCRCACGREKAVRKGYLIDNRSHSCSSCAARLRNQRRKKPS